MNDAHERRVADYVLGQQIAAGSFSRVFLARKKKSDETRCVKVIPHSTFTNAKYQMQLQREIDILLSVSHPNIVRVYEIVEEKSEIFIFMEYCDGITLLQFINRNDSADSKWHRQIFKELVDTLAYLHKNNICHRDIKPENIIIGHDYHIKLLDFGFSKKIDDNELTSTMCGSIYYVAPEVILNTSQDAKASDMWSAGVILYCMTTGRLPWNGRNSAKIIQQITHTEYDIPSNVNPTIAAVINGLLTFDPELRLTAADALRTLWLRDRNSSLDLDFVEIAFKNPELKAKSFNVSRPPKDRLTRHFSTCSLVLSGYRESESSDISDEVHQSFPQLQPGPCRVKVRRLSKLSIVSQLTFSSDI